VPSSKDRLKKHLELWWEKWKNRGKEPALKELLEYLRDRRLDLKIVESTLKEFFKEIKKRKEDKKHKEPIRKLQSILGDAIIITALREEGPQHWTDLKSRVEGILGKSALREHLRELERKGIITRIGKGIYALAGTPSLEHVRMLVEFVMREMGVDSEMLRRGTWYIKLWHSRRMAELKRTCREFLHEHEASLRWPLSSARPERPDQFEKELISDFSLHPEENILDNDLLKELAEAVDARVGWLCACMDELRERLAEAGERIYNARYLTSDFERLLGDLWLYFWPWPWEIAKTLFARGRMLWFLSGIFDDDLWICFLEHVRQTGEEAAKDFEGLSEGVRMILSRLRFIIEGLIELLRSEGCEIPTIITKMAKHDRRKFLDLVKILDNALRQMRDVAGGKAPGLIICGADMKEFFRMPLTDISALIREDRQLAGQVLVGTTFSLLKLRKAWWIGVPIDWDEEIEQIKPGALLALENEQYVDRDSEGRPIYESEIQGRRLRWVKVELPHDIYQELSQELVKLLAETAFKHTDLGKRLEELLQLIEGTLEQLEEFEMHFEQACECVIYYMLAIEGGEVSLTGVCSLCKRKTKNLG